MIKEMWNRLLDRHGELIGLLLMVTGMGVTIWLGLQIMGML